MEWISVDERLPKGEGDIVNVKRKSGEIVKAYYHRDCMGTAIFLGHIFNITILNNGLMM